MSKAAAISETLFERSRHRLGDMTLIYRESRQTGAVELLMVPEGTEDRIVSHRDFLNRPGDPALAGHELKQAWWIDSLVQVKLQDDAGVTGFSQGLTMRNSPTTKALKFRSQHAGPDRVVTILESPRGFRCEHILSRRGNDQALRIRTNFVNESDAPLTLDMLSSFSLSGISPYACDDAPGRLYLHRARSYWAGEGRFERVRLEHLHLEPSWVAVSAQSERFGQVGSMPVRTFFPFAAVEDEEAGVVWAAQIACPGSWQIEVYRKDDFVQLSGGLADREFGHWWKTVMPGESFMSPEALVTVVEGTLESACQRLTGSWQLSAPASEDDLPVIFNEWCTTWGQPTHEKLSALADRLTGTPVRYLVIDAGWSEKPDSHACFQWNVDATKFPRGLKAACDEIRQKGFTPGLWFEFETAQQGTLDWNQTERLLTLDGRPVEAGERRFLDFRSPAVHSDLAARVIGLLREAGVGYIKVDYNECLGIGCDGAGAPGEGLRAHLEGVQEFFRTMRRELPELVIEICASGGHRLEPSMLELGAMASFSDAHETLEIPIIAANVSRLIPPRANQIWAVLRAHDDKDRLAYSLAATFLGRMCLSGDVEKLSASQWATVTEALAMYRKVWPLIADGSFHRFSPDPLNYRHPSGWQGVLITGRNRREVLAIVHTFASAPTRPIKVPLPEGCWRVASTFASNGEMLEILDNHLLINPAGDHRGLVVHLQGSET